jgi:Ca2+-binding RTX toxin-like protein
MVQTLQGIPLVSQWTDLESGAGELPAQPFGGASAVDAERIGLQVTFADGVTAGYIIYDDVSGLWNMANFTGVAASQATGFFTGAIGLHFLYNNGLNLPMAWEAFAMTYSGNFDLDYNNQFGSHFRASGAGWTSAVFQIFAQKVINGDGVANSIAGTTFNDQINGLDGADTLLGNLGHDVLNGGNGADTLDGGAGEDTVNGDAGNDLVYFDPLDAAQGGADFDTLFATSSQNPFAFDLGANGFEQAIRFFNDGPGGAAFLNSYVYYRPGWIVEYQDTNYDDGTRQVLYRDWQANLAYSQYTDYYDGAGQLAARQTVYDDGRIESQFFDLPPNDPFASYIDFYNAGGQLAARQTINDDGSYQSTFFDLTGNPWSFYTDFHNAAGQLIARQTINDDNSYSNTFFDPVPPNANAYAQYTDFFNAAGVFIGRTGINDDGSTF